jgi:magnesium transporter
VGETEVTTMIKIYRSNTQGQLARIDKYTKGTWIHLIDPTDQEVKEVVEETKIPRYFIKDPLDEEEKSRIEKEDEGTLIIVDIPIMTPNGTKHEKFITIPLGIIVTDDYVITVCLKETPILEDFTRKKIKNFYTFMKTRFVLQLFYVISTYYLAYLKQINRKTNDIEKELRQSLKNQELFSLLNLQKSLVYFTTSLKTNQVVTQKISRGQYLRLYDQDQELLEDVIIENKQAIEMAEIYTPIVSGLMDTFASVISNNVNNVMKILTSLTIILTFPIMIASVYGMNIPIPFQHSPYAFAVIMIVSIVLSSITTFVFWKKRYL